ncbi:glycerophosphodiester phosphodiesterase [Rufibacter soli]
MLRILAALFVFLFCASGHKAEAQYRIALTNYSFSETNLEVGKVHFLPTNHHAKLVRLSKESKKHFTFGKDLVLRVRKKLAALPVKWLDLVVEVDGQKFPFRIVKDAFLKNQVIAHRGAWKNTGAPENSLAALQHAIALGCRGSEFDVHMSSDSVLFVHHDLDVKGVVIELTPAADLSLMKLPNGEALPTLASYLTTGLQQNQTKLILEIKPSGVSKARSLALAQQVVALVQQHKAQGWVEYISFDYDILLQVRKLEPFARVAYLNGNTSPADLAKDGMYGFDYNQSVLKNKPHWMEEAQRHRLTTNVWTVNASEEMDWFLERGIDFITTNEPELLMKKVRNQVGK